MKRLLLPCLLLCASLVTHAQSISANVYSPNAALSQESAERATVVAIRPVTLQRTGPNNYTWVGAAVGTTAGYALSRGSSSYAARGVGSLLGGVVGGAVGQSLGNTGGPHTGIQILVQRTFSNGRPNPQLIGVVEADDQGIRAGDHVFLMRGRNGFSIVRDDSGVQP